MIWFLLGLVALVVGAELLVRGASRLALVFGISPLVAGLTVAAFGTSAPERAVSVQSAWSGQGNIALGNVVGSNIFDILAVLGISAGVAQAVLSFDVPIMVAVAVACLPVLFTGHLIARWEWAVSGLVRGLHGLSGPPGHRPRCPGRLHVEHGVRPAPGGCDPGGAGLAPRARQTPRRAA